MQIITDASTLAAGYTSLSSLQISLMREISFSISNPSRNLMTACRKTFHTDLANPFSPNFSDYVHGFGYHKV